MKELEYIPDNNHLDLTDRVAIEIGLARKESFAKIAQKLKSILVLLPGKLSTTEHIYLQDIHMVMTVSTLVLAIGNKCVEQVKVRVIMSVRDAKASTATWYARDMNLRNAIVPTDHHMYVTLVVIRNNVIRTVSTTMQSMLRLL